MNFDLVSAAIGAVVFLLTLFVVYKLAMAVTSLGDDEHDTESTQDRLTMEDRARHRRVGFRRRVGRQTMTMKVFLGAVGILLVYFAIAIYQVAQTGSPAEAAYAGYVQYGVAFLILVGAGVVFKAKQDSKAGEVQIMKEQTGGNSRRTVKFDLRLAHDTDNDTTLVPQLKSNPFLGLFWRPLLVADDPELRDSDHRLPDDLVFWEVPDDESAVWGDRGEDATVRAKRVRTVHNPDRAADYEIVPSERKSQSEINDLENDINELEAELRAERIQNGILSEKITDIENILTNEEYDSLHRVKQAQDALEDEKDDHQQQYDEQQPASGNGRGQPAPQHN
ncbi:hypothetical protein A6E15_19100 [Natrinema saccharevitans]|uniref:Uncharacterized protein n=1 Tax=Natrinema saccharevitans TaxID=301967 RepID=A0A1S8AQD9_9EURY|nr:hypothetical protein [Natrinema saccharevitans]OLZ39073.1 hypothetical protein A6E15_19100 [Natrinema saccharevitans]